MNKYRIIEKLDLSGDVCFIPQYRKFLFWLNFYDLDCFPKLIKFHSLESAENFIRIQSKKYKQQVYYYE